MDNQVTTRWAIRSVILLAAIASLRAQPTIRIASPKDGTLVSPGQTLEVTVEASSEGAFQLVSVIPEYPIGSLDGILKTPPYRFTIQIPQRIDPGRYMLTAIGATRPGGGVAASDSIDIIVEPSEQPSSLRVEPRSVRLAAGGPLGLQVTGVYQDGSTLDLSRSTGTTFTSSDTSVVKQVTQGLFDMVSPGSAVVTVRYGTLKATVPVTVTAKGGR